MSEFYKEIRVEIKIGSEKLYKIKNLPDFYNKFLNREQGKYGSKLEFMHVKENFEEESRSILDFILKNAEIIKYINSSGNAGYRYYGKVISDNCIILSNSGLDEFFDIMKGKTIELKEDNEDRDIKLVLESPDINFSLKQENNEFILKPSIENFEYSVLEGKKYMYILAESKLYRTNREYINTVIKQLDVFKKNYTKEIRFGKKELPDFFSLVVPKLNNNIIMRL